MANIWKQLQLKAQTEGKAFTVLAPMEDVTDVVFRQIVLEVGRPDVFFTEFTNCDGLQSRGRKHVIHRFAFTPTQQPVIAQIWGRNPEMYALTIPTVVEMGFAGVDLNMGCPVPNVVKNNAGGGLIKEPTIATEIIQSVKEAIAKQQVSNVALSVKTRLGFNEIDFSWIELILKHQPDALTVHLRTVKELSKVPAHWELMKKVSALRDTLSPNTVLIGNGDITTKDQLLTYGHLYDVDGLMVGRGILENLWLFSSDKNSAEIPSKQRVALLKRHILLYEETWGKQKNFEMIKKYFKIYLRNFDGAKQLRDELNPKKNATDMVAVIDQWLTEEQDSATIK